MDSPEVRWILAFDGSCATCRKISAVVAQACDEKLKVMPLGDERVRAWRAQALGADAPWAPTLLRVEGDTARTWTGAALVVPLLRRLGPRSSARVLRALGDLRRQDAVHTGARPGTLGRAQFLRLSAGLAVAATVILKGSPPAFAENEAASAHAWVESHRDALPTAYDDVVAYPESYRLAIHEALPAKARSRLWTEHLRRYDEARPGLSADQKTVLRRARALAAEPTTFEGAPPAELREVGEAARAAFGPDEARALLAVLGPSTAVTRSAAALPPPNCGCSIVDGYCGWTDPCVRGGCTTTRTGCGSLWIYPCNGLCYD